MAHIEYVKKFDAIVSTGGDGCHTKKIKAVKIRGLVIPKGSYDSVSKLYHTELQVHFDHITWDTKNDGLIYTDKTFLKNFLAAASHLGFTEENLSYSTMGWQTSTFVSFDFSYTKEFDFSQFKAE